MERQFISRDQALMNKLLEICLTYLKTQEFVRSSLIVQEVENWTKENSGLGLNKLRMVISPIEDMDTDPNGYGLPVYLSLQMMNQNGALSVTIDGTSSSLQVENYTNTTKEKNG